mgnify:CR=1 FL=1
MLLPPCEHCKIATSITLLCKNCAQELALVNPPSGSEALDSLDIAFRYEGGVRTWILDIKDRFHSERWKELIAAYLPTALFERRYDFIIPVTSDPQSNRLRGFDPSFVLAKRLSRLLSVPFKAPVFHRSDFPLPRKAMKHDIGEWMLSKCVGLNSVAAGELSSTSRILLVDDVFTTGSTMNVHARLLRGLVGQVHGFCVALKV